VKSAPGITLQIGRTEYLAFRRDFEPSSTKLVIVAESPPASGKYFYNFAGAVKEPLFAALRRMGPKGPLICVQEFLQVVDLAVLDQFLI
jgi:hypothetical protein